MIQEIITLRDRPIFIAEDDADDRMMAAEAFEIAEVPNKLHFAEDGAALIEDLAELTDKPEDLPGLIILDMNMPKMDGWETLRRLHDDPVLKRIPVLVMSTSSAEEDIDRMYQLNASGYIVKPSSFDGLVDVAKSISQYWNGTVEPYAL